MGNLVSRRKAIQLLGGCAAALGLPERQSHAARQEARWDEARGKALAQMARQQSSLGHWPSKDSEASQFPVAMAALAGTAFLCSGSTTMQGPYSKNLRRTVDFLLSKLRPSGLIGDTNDTRYTYGHGFSMLFLSQVLGEEEDRQRREELIDALKKAVEFSCNAQTKAGGWGYVSAKAMNDFDEGSTTITQVQGLRGCRNAGIFVSSEVIERAKQYIYNCKNSDGGISYSSRNLGASRPAITAASLATLYSAGDYDSQHVPQMLEYAKRNLHKLDEGGASFGHWHYTYLYYSQVVYRTGGEEWANYRDALYDRLVREQRPDGWWDAQVIGPIYVAACNLIMLNLDKGYLPIYQR